MSQVLDAMFEKFCTEGEHIIDQDDDGDNFYVIERWSNILIQVVLMITALLLFWSIISLIIFSFSGTFNIFVMADGGEKLVGCYDNRGSFGELALMYNTPRAATIIATSPGALWCLVSKIITSSCKSTAGSLLRVYVTCCAVSCHDLNKHPTGLRQSCRQHYTVQVRRHKMWAQSTNHSPGCELTSL